MQVTLTQLQLDEIVHKLSILRDEPDLQDSYEVSEAQAVALYERYSAMRPGRVEVQADDVDILLGELENCVEIAEANIEAGDDDYVPYRRAMRDAIRKIRVCP